MVRAPFYDKNGLKRGAWSAEEDHKLRSYVLKYGHWNWREIPRFAGIQRCGKSCRLRWKNYLRPELKHGNFTKEEDAMIMKLHAEFGNRWSMIAAKLHGRTDNEIKNHWHTHLKKLTKQNLTKSDQVKENCSTFTSHGDAVQNSSEGEAESICIGSPPNMILESSSLPDIGSISIPDFGIDFMDDVFLPSSFTPDSGSMSDFNVGDVFDLHSSQTSHAINKSSGDCSEGRRESSEGEAESICTGSPPNMILESSSLPDIGSISDFGIDFMDDVFLPSSFTPDSGSMSDFNVGDVFDLRSSQTSHEINKSSGDLWREFFGGDNIYNNQVAYPSISSPVRNEFEMPVLPFDNYLDDSADLLEDLYIDLYIN